MGAGAERRAPTVAVIGATGSGKTTLARRLAERLGVPHVELDALHWGPGWSQPTTDDFRARVRAAMAGDGWVVDGNYGGKLGRLVLEQADLVVWLDPPLRTILWRLVRRTLRRIRTREELWNGNRESLRNLLSWSPEESVIRWSWSRHAVCRERYATAAANPGHLRFVRIASRADARRLVERARTGRDSVGPDL